MAYIEDSRHFANSVNKSLKLKEKHHAYDENGEQVESVDLAFLQKEIYEAGFADRFTWVAKENPEKYLSKANVIAFIKKEKEYRESHQ